MKSDRASGVECSPPVSHFSSSIGWFCCKASMISVHMAFPAGGLTLSLTAPACCKATKSSRLSHYPALAKKTSVILSKQLPLISRDLAISNRLFSVGIVDAKYD